MKIGPLFDAALILYLLIVVLRPPRHARRPDAARVAALDARLERGSELHRLLRAGKTVAAIRLYRQDTGASLVEAKAAVGRLGREARPSA